MKLIRIIAPLYLSLLIACSGDPSSTVKKNTSDEELPEMSVYNLTSNWTTESNEPKVLADLRGNVVVMALIFTSCEYACPRLVADMKALEAGIDPKEMSNVNFVLVSIDPDTDTPEKLKAFSIEKELDLSHWTLLNGSKDDVLELAVTLGVKYAKISAIDFSHSNIISVFSRNGELEFQQEGFGTENSPTLKVIKDLISE